MTLKPNERLVYVGEAALRAPDGRKLPAIPQYMIVPAENADPASIVELQQNERLVMAGTIHNRKDPTDVKTLYVKEAAENINASTGLSKGEEKVCDAIIGDVMDIFRAIAARDKALSKQKAGAEVGSIIRR